MHDDPGRLIGTTLRDAITWTQDTLHTTRPLAEQVILSAIEANRVVWQDGVYLLESDDEMEDRKKATTQSMLKAHNASKKWHRLSFRNASRTQGRGRGGKTSTSSLSKKATGTFSGAAEEMIARGEHTLRPRNEDEEIEPGK